MKIAIGHPPLESGKGIPLLGQNRQFQWFHNPCYIYPMVPAMAATLLKQAGFDVVWLDGIAGKLSYEEWFKKVREFNPDLVVMETKTPVVKRHWEIINQFKVQSSKFKVILVGDHVTALPEESMNNSRVDYVLTGGDYDFLLLNLCKHLTEKEKLEPGIWHREQDQRSKTRYQNSGKFELNHDLNKLPFIDRELTKWKLYAYDNGNYKETPGTYTMAGRDCWWAKCTFCSWTTLYPNFRARTAESLLDEVGVLIEKYGVKEIMDDTGTFPAGEWLREFCRGMIKRGYNNKIAFDCNLRFGALKREDYELMAKAGFRFLLYGLESANQKTLERLHKGIKVGEIEKELERAKQANVKVRGNLQPHVTCMVGYPWESDKDAKKTIEMTRGLFDRGLIDTLQATIVIPYPGTPLFKECLKNDWLKTQDWDQYDMSRPVMRTEMQDDEIMALTREIYKSFVTPRFLVRKIFSMRTLADAKFFLRAGKAVWGHLLDFKHENK